MAPSARGLAKRVERFAKERANPNCNVLAGAEGPLAPTGCGNSQSYSKRCLALVSCMCGCPDVCLVCAGTIFSG